MEQRNFMDDAKSAVAAWLNEHYGEGKAPHVGKDDVFVVWQCKTLQNSKALLAAPTPDNFFFEATYNGDKEEVYLDVYDKMQNILITREGNPVPSQHFVPTSRKRKWQKVEQDGLHTVWQCEAGFVWLAGAKW